ncbi:MAG: hypothetical protein WAM53_17530, partial [Terrimicrobiaceae bacterium]
MNDSDDVIDDKRLSARRGVVQGDVQLEDVDAGFAEDAKRPAIRGFDDFCVDGIESETALCGHAWSLELS